MTKPTHWIPRTAKSVHALVLFVFLNAHMQGQSMVNQYTFSVSTGTYTSIANVGTYIGTGDNAAFGGLPIGFTFTYRCVDFTTFGVTTNGFMRLGATPPSGSNNVNYKFAAGTDATDSNTIGGLAADLYNMYSQAGKMWYQTTGTPGTRVCTIEWQRMYFWGASADYSDDANFQIQLYEGTNAIRIVYGPAFESGYYNRYPQVGLRGVSNTDYNLIDDQGGTLQWNAVTTTTTGGNTLTKLWGISNTNVPNLGLTYSWLPPVASCLPLGTPDANGQDAIIISPNPLVETATLTIYGRNAAGNKTLKIFDLTGKEKTRIPFDGNSCRITKGTLADGLYLYRLENGNGESLGDGKIVFQ